MTGLRRLIAGHLQSGETEIARSFLGKDSKQLAVLTDRRLLLLQRHGRRNLHLVRAIVLDQMVGVDHGRLNERGHGATGFPVVVRLADGAPDGDQVVAVTAFGPAETSLRNLVLRLERMRPRIAASPLPRPRDAWRWLAAGAGVVCLVIGVLIGHGADIVWTQLHEPTTVASVDWQHCYQYQSDSGDQELCDVDVHFHAEGHRYRRTLRAIDAGDMGSGTLLVAYQPSSPNLIVPARENSDAMALGFGAASVLFVVFAYRCFRPLWRYRIER